MEHTFAKIAYRLALQGKWSKILPLLSKWVFVSSILQKYRPVYEMCVYNRSVRGILLLKESLTTIDAKDELRWTLLCEAAYLGNLDLLQYCLQRGANVNHQDVYGNTPLMRACQIPQPNRLVCIKALLKAGADPLIRARDNRTVLEMVIDWNRINHNIEVIELFIMGGGYTESALSFFDPTDIEHKEWAIRMWHRYKRCILLEHHYTF